MKIKERLEPAYSKEEIDLMTISKLAVTREHAAHYGHPGSLDILMKDKEYNARIAVAHRGHGLDRLVRDKVAVVLIAVIRQKRDKDLDILVSHKSPLVRCVVAEQGRQKDLKQLINDLDWMVRQAVAITGYRPDILKSDEKTEVSKAAEQHYNLWRTNEDRIVLLDHLGAADDQPCISL